MDMNSDGAPGEDLITIKMYRNLPSTHPVISRLVNGVLKYGVLPMGILDVIVVVLDKPG